MVDVLRALASKALYQCSIIARLSCYFKSQIPLCPMPSGLEMSRPASSSILSQTRFAAAGRGGSIELLGGQHVVLRG